MGGACCTCSEEKKYRFKGFVVSVYPDDIKGGPDEDALGKLNSYVASNPERIPRVCRKINKLMQVHLRRRKVDRVMVSVKMLRSLIEHAKSVNGFVPHSLDICAQLLSMPESRYKVGAADILCVLCNRLEQDPESEPSRRLVADSKDRLLPPLRYMCGVVPGKEASSSMTMASVVQLRYAAVVAIGHLARCLNGALAGNVTGLFFPIVSNLLSVLKNRAVKPVGGDVTGIETLLFTKPSATTRATSAASPTAPGSGSGGGGPSSPSPVTASVAVPTSAELSSTETDPDLAYARTCVFAVGATAGCVTAATVEPLTQQLITFLGEKNGWSTPSVPVVVFKALVGAMQERPQGLGFTVFQCLCAAGNVNADPVVRIGILRALDACVAILPMSGGRPQFILNYLHAAILAAPVDVRDANTKPTLNAIVSVTASLLRSIFAQRNSPQLQSVLAMLTRLLSDCTTAAIEPTQADEESTVSEEEEEDHSAASGSASHGRRQRRQGRSKSSKAGVTADNAASRTYLALRCTAAASAYVRSTPLIDRQNGALDVCNVIEPFLNSGNDAHRTWAARILRGVLAGMPAGDAAGVSSGAVVLSTDEYDVAFAEAWVKAVVMDSNTVTPRCVVEVGSVLTAVMAGYGINALPFVLTTLWSLQQRCVSGDAAYDPNSSNMVTSTMPTSPLTRAWLQLVLAVLASAGKVYEIPKLTEYAQDILGRRQAMRPSELATCFEPALRESTKPEFRFTVCGLCVTSANGSKKDTPLSAAASLPPVTKLPSFSFVANIIVDADRPDVIAVFGATAANDLKTSIERVCFSAESANNVSMDHSDMLSQAAGAQPSELRRADTAFILNASPQQLQGARQMQVSLVDRPPSALSGGLSPSARSAGSGAGVFASLSATSNAARVGQVLEKLHVDATTHLLPPDTEVAASPPLFTVPAAARGTLVARGRVHNRQVRRSQHNKVSQVDDATEGASDEATSDSGVASSDAAMEAQATLANIEADTQQGTGALALALRKQREAQDSEGGRYAGSAGSGGLDGGTRRPWFSLLPSSRYVDLE